MIVRGSETREFSAERLLVLFASSIGIAYGVAFLWYAIDGSWLLYLPSMLVMLGVALLNLAAHEVIHFVALPKTINERGLGISAHGAFVSMRGKMTRNRALVVLLAPFIVLTGGPLLWRLAIGPVDDHIVWASIWNGAGSIFDLIFSFLLLRHVPAGALLHVGTGAIRFEVTGAASDY